MKTVLFDPTQFPGSGPVYAPDQSVGNWLNIPERLVSIESRPDLTCESGEIRGFPSYQDWTEAEGGSASEKQIDRYPRRAELGNYLMARFDSLAESLMKHGWLTVFRSEVERIDFVDGHVTIASVDGQLTMPDEVVLAIGHQPVEPDKSMVRWRAYTEIHPQLTLLSEPSGHEPLRIVPFSLNGLPLVPKPLNAFVDKRFDPDLSLKHWFEEECSRLAAAQGDVDDSLNDLIEMVSEIQVSQFLSLGKFAFAHSLSREQLLSVARQWLADEEFQHDLIVSKELPVGAAMRIYLRMACGQNSFSFDYCQGQVWRHLQPILFKCLSHSSLPAESISEIIKLHERMKRYSYGPPVDAMQRLVALSQCGLLSYIVVDDPDIELTPHGWKFQAEQNSVCANIMIDSVLASPDLEKVSSPLVWQLRNEQRILPFAESLGVLIAPDGLVKNGIRESSAPLAILGRMAKGSLIGTDSLTECFGEQQRHWAKSLVGRLSNLT